MALPRAFVSFSSTDINYDRTMMMWNANEHIDFNFADFQLDETINSRSPSYIKSVCEAKIRRVDTFILLIGADTWQKTSVRRLVFLRRAYTSLSYNLIGTAAVLPPKPNPFLLGKPQWAKQTK